MSALRTPFPRALTRRDFTISTHTQGGNNDNEKPNHYQKIRRSLAQRSLSFIRKMAQRKNAKAMKKPPIIISANILRRETTGSTTPNLPIKEKSYARTHY